MLKCSYFSDKESGRGCCNLSGWRGCALCSWRCKSPWNRYCRFHPCRRSWRSGRRRPWRCRRGESWSTSPGSCPCSAARPGSPAWILYNGWNLLQFNLLYCHLYHSLISCSSYLVFFFRKSMSSWVKVCDTFLPLFLYFPPFPGTQPLSGPVDYNNLLISKPRFDVDSLGILTLKMLNCWPLPGHNLKWKERLFSWTVLLLPSTSKWYRRRWVTDEVRLQPLVDINYHCATLWLCLTFLWK